VAPTMDSLGALVQALIASVRIAGERAEHVEIVGGRSLRTEAAEVTNFVILDSEDKRVPGVLTREIPGFSSSEEFESLDPSDRHSPVFVCPALARYWLRLQRQEQAGGMDAGAAESLSSIYRTVEALAASNDLGVQNLVVTEILENLDADMGLIPLIKSRLGERTRQLYDRWLGGVHDDARG
jgi:hypothetical protein